MDALFISTAVQRARELDWILVSHAALKAFLAPLAVVIVILMPGTQYISIRRRRDVSAVELREKYELLQAILAEPLLSRSSRRGLRQEKRALINLACTHRKQRLVTEQRLRRTCEMSKGVLTVGYLMPFEPPIAGRIKQLETILIALPVLAVTYLAAFYVLFFAEYVFDRFYAGNWGIYRIVAFIVLFFSVGAYGLFLAMLRRCARRIQQRRKRQVACEGGVSRITEAIGRLADDTLTQHTMFCLSVGLVVLLWALLSPGQYALGPVSWILSWFHHR